MKELESQVKVCVGVKSLWQALAKDLKFVVPKIVPNFVKNVELIEGDGGLGTVFQFNFTADVPNNSYQKEMIVELDENSLRFGLQVMEGGHLNLGFSFYKTTFQLSAMGEEAETWVNINVSYESEVESHPMPTETIKSCVTFIKSLENYLLN